MFLSYFFIFILCHKLFLWFPFSSLLYLVLIYEIFFSFSSISLLSIRFYFTSSCYFAISSLGFYISVLWWFLIPLGFPGGSDSKNLPLVWETWVHSLGWEDPLEKGTATYSSILAWRIPWTEEPGRQQSMGSQRVRHDLAIEQQQYFTYTNYFKTVFWWLK